VSAPRKGSTVRWNYGQGQTEGKVVDTFTEHVTRKIKGKEITRNGSKEDPAVLIEQDDGDQVLKLSSELVGR
jgi:phage terminase small subunit